MLSTKTNKDNSHWCDDRACETDHDSRCFICSSDDFTKTKLIILKVEIDFFCGFSVSDCRLSFISIPFRSCVRNIGHNENARSLSLSESYPFSVDSIRAGLCVVCTQLLYSCVRLFTKLRSVQVTKFDAEPFIQFGVAAAHRLLEQ